MEEFCPTRGVREGDSIYSYLFVLCIERLFHLIQVAFDTGYWRPIQLAKNAPKLTHLAFAEDLLVFTEASEDQAETICHILSLFCKSSKQRFKIKTSIYFSKKFGWQRRQLSQRLGFSFTDDLGKYRSVSSFRITKSLPARFSVLFRKWIRGSLPRNLANFPLRGESL